MHQLLAITNKLHVDTTPLIKKYWENNIPKQIIKRFTKCIITPTNHLFVKNKYIPSGLIKPFDDKHLNFFQRNYLYIKSRFLNPKTVLSGEFIWYYDSWSGNYYHWFCETLPKIYHLHTKNPDIKVLIPDNHTRFSYVEESLTILDISYNIINHNHTLFIDKIHTIQPEPAYGYIEPNFQKNLTNAILNKLKISKGHSASNFKHVYLSRKQARYRKIINEEELLPILEKHGFQVIISENLTFKEQVKIFSETKILIALHGAGHTNMMFMPSGSTIIELRNEQLDSMPLCYFELSNVYNHTWNYLTCKPVGKVDNFNNIIVDTLEFEQLLLNVKSNIQLNEN